MNSSDATLFFEGVVGVQVALLAKAARRGRFFPIQCPLVFVVANRRQSRDATVLPVHANEIACALQRSCRTGWPATRHEVRMGSIHGSEAVLPFTLVESLVLSRKSLHGGIDLRRCELLKLSATGQKFLVGAMPLGHQQLAICWVGGTCGFLLDLLAADKRLLLPVAELI